MSDANNISVRGMKVADTENVTFKGAIFDWLHFQVYSSIIHGLNALKLILQISKKNEKKMKPLNS